MDRYEQYAQDALVLGRIGAVLFPQDTKLSVRLPKELADLALAAWNRDDPDEAGSAALAGEAGAAGLAGTAGEAGLAGEAGAAGEETAGQRALRDQAGYLALIGLCIENTAQPDGNDVVCDLDSWYIGGALQAAESMDMLPGHCASRGQ